MQKEQTSSELKQNCELPDRQVSTISSERFRYLEVIFERNFIGLQQDGIHKLTFSLSMKCDVDNRTDLFNDNVRLHTKKIKSFAPDSNGNSQQENMVHELVIVFYHSISRNMDI